MLGVQERDSGVAVRDPLAAILVERRILSPEDALRWLDAAESAGRYLEEILIEEGSLNARQLREVLENHYFCPAVDLSTPTQSPEALALIPRDVAEQHLALAIGVSERTLRVAFSHPDVDSATDDVKKSARRQVARFVALRHELAAAIRDGYDQFDADVAERGGNEEARNEAAAAATTGLASIDFSTMETVAIVDAVFSEAAKVGCTDVHFEPGEEALVVRFRMDGVLNEVARLSSEQCGPVTSRLKVMGGMDIAERRVPQDGRHSIEVSDRVLDLRISSLPAQHGESIVIRMLEKSQDLLNLDKLSMPAQVRESCNEMVDMPRGLFLVTGPTGSGKTTTLYATLGAIDRASTKVITLEDPIEYSLPGITQVQINDTAGLTFSAGLSSILRQDPDVILVGEIRDVRTVEIAARAALTGHKVFSTLHTNDACQAVTRLTDMGTDVHLVSATLRGVLAQRLVRVTCDGCRTTHEASETELALLGYPKITTLTHGAGCTDCGGTGYRGRMAVFEYFRVDENVQRLILDRASVHALRHAAKQAGMVSMAEFARQAVLGELTTVAEVQRVVFAGEDKEQLCPACQRAVSVEFAVCPYCQNVLKDQCSSCRTAVEPHWEACPSCGEEIARNNQTVLCRHCVAPIESTDECCPFCGGTQ